MCCDIVCIYSFKKLLHLIVTLSIRIYALGIYTTLDQAKNACKNIIINTV